VTGKKAARRIKHPKRNGATWWTNVVDKRCGGTIRAARGAACGGQASPPPGFARLAPRKPGFWLEARVVYAFGVSWLVKGATRLPDKADPARLAAAATATATSPTHGLNPALALLPRAGRQHRRFALGPGASPTAPTREPFLTCR